MQNIVVAKIDRDVSHPLNSRAVLPRFVGKIDAIPPLELAFGNVFALLDLRTRGRLQQHARAHIKGVLRKRRAVEFVLGEIFKAIAVAVVVAHRTVDVGHAE